MSKTARIVNAAIFCSWIFLICLLLYRNYAGTSIEKAAALKGSIDKVTYWYDVYAGAKKIGLAHTSFETVGEEIIIQDERQVKVFKNGKEDLLTEKVKCLSDLHYSIKSLEFSSHFGDGKGIKATGRVDSGDVIFFLESAEQRKTHRTPTKGGDFYLSTTFIPALVRKNPAPGAVFTVPVLDFNSLSIHDLKVVLEEIRPIKVGITIVSLYKFKAGNAIWWSNEKGTIVKEESPAGMTLYLQSEAVAKDPSDRALFDYTVVPFFRSNRVLPNVEGLKMLKVRIKGFPVNSPLYDMSLVAVKDDTLTIRKEDSDEIKKRSYVLPCKDSALDRYLKADEWILSEDKNVKGNAHNMAVIEKNDAFRMTRYLNSNLYFSIAAVPTFVLLTSADLLKTRFGDHLGRTVMFASFARAAGVPTRLIGGLVYREGYFYFHTWPEAWFDRWIPMDPTLAQFPADVTHIPLKEGTVKEITSVVNDLKSLTIEVLEVS